MRPHDGQPVETRGPSPGEARAGAIVVHGRGAAPANILTVADAIGLEEVAWLAPAAAGNTWYPYSFLAETEKNEPGITSGLAVIDGLMGDLEARGLPPDRVVLLGFSQGACLAGEYAVRHARRYGGVVLFSGGLIGPPGTTWDDSGDFEGTPVFLGCSDVDPHIPLARVRESEEVFRRMGADVTTRIYPGMGHLVNEDEIAFARDLFWRLVG